MLVGRLSDIFSRRWVVIAFNVCALIGAIIAACARTIPTLIVANVFTGFGAAGLLSILFFVIGELVFNKARGPINSLMFVTAVPWSTFGPVVIRALIEHTKQGYL